MPADLSLSREITREQLDRYRHPGMHFSDKGGLEVTVARGMFEHLLRVAEAYLDEPARLASARQEGYREGVEAAAQWCRVRAYCAAIREREATDEQSRRAALLVKQTLDHAADVLPALSPAPAEPATPVAPDERRALNAEAQDYMIACGQHAEARRVAEARIDALEAENAKLREGLKDTTAHLVAAHSLLSRTPRAKKAAPSNTMFDMMLRDYETSCERARALLQGGPDAG